MVKMDFFLSLIIFFLIVGVFLTVFPIKKKKSSQFVLAHDMHMYIVIHFLYRLRDSLPSRCPRGDDSSISTKTLAAVLPRCLRLPRRC